MENLNNNKTEDMMLIWPKVVLYGDSITQYGFSSDGCWVSLLADKLIRKCDIIDRGFSGYNTRWNKIVLPRIVNALIAKDLAAITIFLGANDAADAESNKNQHVPVVEYKQNLLDMIEYLMSVGVDRQKIILITPPPIDEPGRAEYCRKEGKQMSRSLKEVQKYAKACVEAASEGGTHCVDLYSAMVKHEKWQRFLNDGLHLSASGSAFLESLLWPQVEQLTEHLPIILPTYDMVDNAEPSRSLLPQK